MKMQSIKLPFYKKSDNNIFSNIFLSFTVWTVVIIFLLSTVLYFNFEKIYLISIQSSIKDSLSQVSYSSSYMSETAKRLATQIYFDLRISKLFYNYDLSFDDVKKALDQVNSYKSCYPYVYSIYLYNSNLQNFYTSLGTLGIISKKDFFDKEIVTLISNHNTNIKFSPIPHKIPDSFSLDSKDFVSNVYTYIFRDSTNPANISDNVVILNISQDWIREIIQSLDANSAQNTYIIDTKGILVNSNIKENSFTDLSGNAYIQNILKSESSSGYFIENVAGEKALVTYVSAETLGWKFIRITPYPMIMKNINTMKMTTVSIGFFILLVGFAISIFISRKLYKPFDGLLHKLNILNSERRNNLSTIKQELLSTLLHNKYDHKNSSLQMDFDKLEIKLDIQNYFMLVIFKIDHHEKFCSQFNSKDRHLFKYAIMNIATELCDAKFANIMVDMLEDHMVLLISSPTVPSNICKELESLIISIQLNVEKHLQLSLSAAISDMGKGLNDIGLLYNETLILARYRVFYGHKCILYPQDISVRDSMEYIYPLEKEKALIDTLMLGKTNEVKTIYLNIIADAAKSNFATFNSTILRIAVAVNAAISMIEKNNILFLSNNCNDFIFIPNTLETLEEINQHFFSIFDFVSEKLEEKKNGRYDKLVSQIIEAINTDYMNQNLSREGLADSVNMTPAYLGQLFKNSTGKSISDYINDKRMEKAKELFISTEYTVNEIVEKIGYVNVSYFCTLFKKLNGLTPNEYRKNFSAQHSNNNHSAN